MSSHQANFGAHVERALVPGALRGYRAWVKYDNQLYPINARPKGCQCHDCRNGAYDAALREFLHAGSDLTPWTAGKNTAICNPSLRMVLLAGTRDYTYYDLARCPNMQCTCGFYGLSTPRIPEQYMVNHRSSGYRLIKGSFLAHGRVILGEIGFRAQYARIEAIVGDGNERVAKHYNIPTYRSMRKLVEAHPPHDVETIIDQ